MSTKTIVDEIKKKAPAWNRDGQNSICQMLNRAQNLLFSKPCRATVYVDKATGKHPFLTTVAGQFEYDIPDGSIIIPPLVTARPLRMLIAVEVYTKKQTPSNEYSQVLMDRGDIGIVSDRLVVNTLNTEATAAAPARVTFPFDPGDTTDTYQVEALIEPLQITADTIPLMVSNNWEMALIDGALGFIEYYDYGRSDRLQTFKQVHAPEFWEAYNSLSRPNGQSATPVRRF